MIKCIMSKITTPTSPNIPVETRVYTEYIEFHNIYHKREYLKKELASAEKKLREKNTKTNSKKKILFRLAHTSLPEAYEILRKYIFETKGHLQQWTAICLQESQMQIQTSLADKDQILVSSPAGGDGQRLRIFVVFTTKRGRVFKKKSRDVIDNLIHKHVEVNDGVVEKITWSKNYVLISMLHSIKVAPEDMVMPIMKEGKGYIRYHYYADNTKRPSKKDIEEYLDFLKEENIS